MDNKDETRLKSVRRIDQHVTEIVDSAPRTALYNYNGETDSWSKTDVEGTLMIYKREAPPIYMIIIINRMKKTNFIEALTPSCDIQLSSPFLLFRNTNGLIFGIWFSESAYVENISATIREKIALSGSNSGQGSTNLDKESTNVIGGGGDIMRMLSKAHNDFEVKKVEPVSSSSNVNLFKPSPVRAGGCPNNSDVANFFAKVGNASAASSSGLPSVNNRSGHKTDSTNPVLQKLFEGAAAIGGQASVGASTSSAPIPIAGGVSGAGALPPHNTPQSSSVPAPMSLQELEGKLKENLRIGSNKEEFVFQEPFLPPHVFTSPIVDKSSATTAMRLPLTKSVTPNEISQVNLFPGFGFGLNGSRENVNNHSDDLRLTSPMTKEQLVQAFTVLLKKPDFVQQLHEAYMQSFKSPL